MLKFPETGSERRKPELLLAPALSPAHGLGLPRSFTPAAALKSNVRTAHAAVPGDSFTPLNAFTLVELLTVIAIISVLATLLTSAVSSAKKAAHQARCAANLHQLSLALDMYLDDHERRSPDLGHLSSSRYLPNKGSLICPSDKTKNWGGLIENDVTVAASDAIGMAMPDSALTGETVGQQPVSTTTPMERSYLTPLGWDDEAWGKLMKAGGNAGVAACQLHGLGRANLEFPSIRDFQGLVLRGRRDGAVVKRQIFWEADPPSSIAPSDGSEFMQARTMAPSLDSSYPWKLFRDDTDAEE